MRRERPRLLPLPASSAAVPGAPFALRYVTLRETTGTASATVRFWNGSSAAGVIALDVQLAPAESIRERFDPEEIILDVGLFVDLAAGAVEGGFAVQEVAPGTSEGHDPDVIVASGATIYDVTLGPGGGPGG